VLHLVSEPTLEVTRACAGQVRGHMARRGKWVGTGRMDVSKRESSWPGADRRGRRSSKGVSVCHLGLGINRINRILISTSCNIFSGNIFQRNFGLSVLGLE
jgi:hypothetical protein